MGRRDDAAACRVQAAARTFLFRKSSDRHQLMSRLDAYSKWTPVTVFHAYCRLAQHATMMRSARGTKDLLHISMPVLHLLNEHLDEASFLCLCMDCCLVQAVSLNDLMSLFRHHSVCASIILIDRLRRVLVLEDTSTQDRLRCVLELEHVAKSHIERCLGLFSVKAPTHHEVIELLDKLGVFSAYRIVDQHGFSRLMVDLARCCGDHKGA
mmetsp:Transcript_34231/g.105155  ORF Transcript_34231/g.105155 Transcript_34231/m.105155 type:complete len:210 (-) Transcript_34231:4340-4969(-)